MASTAFASATFCYYYYYFLTNSDTIQYGCIAYVSPSQHPHALVEALRYYRDSNIQHLLGNSGIIARFEAHKFKGA